MNFIIALLQKCRLVSQDKATSSEREQADTDNVLWENTKAFEQAKDIYEAGSIRANVQLLKAVRRVQESNPFADLENLAKIRKGR